MMFQADTAFALELLALAAGAYLLIVSYTEIQVKRFIKFVSFFVIIASFLAMVCTSIFTIAELMYGRCRSMNGDSFWCPMQMHHMMEDHDSKKQNTQKEPTMRHMEEMMKQDR